MGDTQLSKPPTSAIATAIKSSYFLNSEGSFISQERADVTLHMSAIAADGSEVQQTNMSLGSLGHFAAIQNLDGEIKEMAQRALGPAGRPPGQGRRVHRGAGPDTRRRLRARGLRPPVRGRFRL